MLENPVNAYYFAVQNSVETQNFVEPTFIRVQILAKHFFPVEETIYSNLGVL